MTSQEIQKILDQITYKPDYALIHGVTNDVPWIQVTFVAPCSITGKPEVQKCRKWMLSYHMVENEIVRTAYLAFEQAEIHEVQETFKYKGAAIYGPHVNPSIQADMLNLLGEGATQSRAPMPAENIYGPSGI